MGAWQGEVSSVRHRIKELYERNCFTDVSFAFLEKSESTKHLIKAHTNILASASEVFEKMFFGSLPENTSQEILIEEIAPRTFAAMLKFIYTEELDFQADWQNLTDLLYASNKYMLIALSEKCVLALIDLLTPTNALQLYEFGDLHNLQNLQQAALKVVQRETLQVIKSPFFNDIAISTLKAMVEQDCLQTNELELFNAVELLAKRKGLTNSLKRCNDNKDNEVRNGALWKEFKAVISEIRFLSMVVREFYEGPSTSAFLTSQDAYDIMVCQSLPDKIEEIYPKDFTRKRRQTPYPRVFFDIEAAGRPLGRIVMELRSDIVPRFAENFRSLCLGESDFGFRGSKLTYDARQKVFFGNAIYFKTGSTLPFTTWTHENFTLKHNSTGVLGMIRVDNQQKPSKYNFYITFHECEERNNKNVVIGKVIEGLDLLHKMKCALESSVCSVVIEKCGEA